MPRKPTGTNGPLRITSGADAPEFLQLRLPSEKPKIEAFILGGALRALKALDADVYH